MSLKHETVSGVAWTALSRIVRQLLQFLTVVVLARLLTPEDFGLVAMIVVFTGFATLFVDAGFGAALVQRRELEERHLSSVFWLNLTVGLALAAAMALAAPLVASFYGEPRLKGLTVALSSSFALGAFSVVQLALARRAMDFRRIAWIEILSALVAAAVAVFCALRGYGAWALVAQTLVGAALLSLTLWLASAWKPRALFQLSAVRELLGFSGNLLGFNAFNYWVRNADNLLIGRFVGSSALGIYGRAYGVMLLPLQQVTFVMGQVLFPALARIQEDVGRVKDVYLRANRVVALAVFPMVFGLAVVAEPFVQVVFGPAWLEVAPVLRILCLVALVQPLRATTSWIYQSRGRTDLQFLWGVVSGVVTVGAFLIGVRWGVLGCAAAYAIRTYALLVPGVLVPGRLIDLSFGAWARNLGSALACSLVMALLVWSTSFLLSSSASPGLRLALQVSAGVGAYAALVHGARLAAYREVREILAERRRARSEPGRDGESGTGA